MVAVVLLVFLVRGSSLKFDFARRSFPLFSPTAPSAARNFPDPEDANLTAKKE